MLRKFFFHFLFFVLTRYVNEAYESMIFHEFHIIIKFYENSLFLKVLNERRKDEQRQLTRNIMQ